MSNFEQFDSRRVCEPDCSQYRPGHRMHFIQHRLAVSTPWAWRSALVLWVKDNEALLTYWEHEATFSLWHHQPLDGLIIESQTVELNENFHVLRADDFWSVTVTGGLGKVATPPNLKEWANRVGHNVYDPEMGDTVSPSE